MQRDIIVNDVNRIRQHRPFFNWAWIGLAAILALAQGCAMLSWVPGVTPTLQAAWVSAVPKPTGTYVTDLWKTAKPIVVNARRGALVRPVRLQAIHDGHTLAIFMLWFDPSESLERRTWVWNDAARQYRLEEFNVDQAAIEWPLKGSARFCMLAGGEAEWDVWMWRAGWTDLSGIAEDGRMTMTVRPPGTLPSAVAGRLYPALHGKNRIEVRFEPDAGQPSVVALPRPPSQVKLRMPGAGPVDASGSVADVRARGLYQPYLSDTSPGYWFDTDKHKMLNRQTVNDQERGFWMVDFHRTLTTDDKTGDVQLGVERAADFAVAIWDGASGADHYTTGPIRLTFQKAR